MAPLYVSEHSEFDTVEFLSSPKRIKKIHWDIWQNIRYHGQYPKTSDIVDNFIPFFLSSNLTIFTELAWININFKVIYTSK